MRLRGLDIILTYECTGRCAHCCYRAGPGQGQTMTAEEVERCLAAVAEHPIDWILLFGGEPFLCHDLLRASVALAAAVAGVLVFTNGYWAVDTGSALERLAELRGAGLDHILFSVDAFHQEHVPLGRIATGIEAARALGFGRIEVDNRWLGAPDEDNAYNQRTREIIEHLAEMCDLQDVQIYQGSSRMVGRAADELRPHAAVQPGSLDQCVVPGWLGADIRCPSTVEIHPGGWVNLCAGIALGNIRHRSLDLILDEYDPHTHPIVGPLVREGPLGLLALAERHGYVSEASYVDACHLCYQVRRFLHPYYPDELAPAHVYVGDPL